MLPQLCNSTTSVLLCYSMILPFANQANEDIYDGKISTKARRIIPRNLWNIAVRKFDQIDASVLLDNLRVPPGNSLGGVESRPNRAIQHRDK